MHRSHYARKHSSASLKPSQLNRQHFFARLPHHYLPEIKKPLKKAALKVRHLLNMLYGIDLVLDVAAGRFYYGDVTLLLAYQGTSKR